MKHILFSLCVLGLCGVACDSDEPTVPTLVPSLDAPVLLDDQLLFVDGPQRTAALLDVSAERPEAKSLRVPLPANASLAQRRNGHDEALVLCAGERGDKDTDPEPATLVAIDDRGRARNYELGTTPFNALAQSEDGRYAIAYRLGPTRGRTLDNPNELIVVNLERAPDEDGAVTRKAPDGLGHTLTSVLISPSMRIAEEDRRLLVLLSAAEVTLFDLNHLDRRATIVQLNETRNVDPVQVVFSRVNPTLYVRTASSDNIFMFRFEPFTNPIPGGNDFQPAINPLSGGSGPSDMALFGSGSSERLLVVAQRSSQALVIDPSSSKTQTIALKNAAERILLWQGLSPRDTNERWRALLYNDEQPGMTFLDPEELGSEPADSVEQLTLTSNPARLIPLLDQQQVIALQSTGVNVLDLTKRTVTPIASAGPLSGALFDDQRKHLWVGPTGQTWLGSLDLQSGMTDELRLDAPIQALWPMLGHRRLVVLHGESTGYLTLVDLEQPDREHALSLRGYLADALFDRSTP